MTEDVPSNQAGLRIQIPRNTTDGSTNLNKLLHGTVTLINSMGATVSISVSKSPGSLLFLSI